MQIKSKKIFISLLFFLLLGTALDAEEFNITANEVLIDKNNETLIGTGSVKAIDTKGKTIYADKINYNKKKEYLVAEGNVKIVDEVGNVITATKASFDKMNEILITYENTKVTLNKNYNLSGGTILYNTKAKILSSDQFSVFNDKDGNIVETSMFQYTINDNLFSSIGKIKVIDINKNKYSFKEIHVDTNTKEIIGSDVSVMLDQDNFGLNDKFDPRFVANDIYMSKNDINLSKGVFTTCKLEGEKCPPWSLKAKKIKHDKVKKTIYYEHATLKIYDIPVFYFPKFFHPDPTVKRQSGFLTPFFSTSSTVGSGFALPYYWAISNSRDLTFTPKVYAKENVLLLNEYRQAFKNGFLTLDTSFTEGYKKTDKLKTDGSRNHIFANIDFNLNKDDSYESNLSVKVQRTSNDTYFRIHDINTSLVNSENTNLESEFRYNFSKDNMYIDINTSVYENLDQKLNSDKYEYVLPNIMYGKTFFSENFGALDFKTNAIHTNYETNKNKSFLYNDIIWSPASNITKKGFINTLQGMIRNTNYVARKTGEYKDEDSVNEISGVLSYKSSLPMKKDGLNYSNLISPNFMIRYAPGHMRDLSSKDITLDLSNLYSLNKTSEIEGGLSAIAGFDFKINENETNKEKLSISIGQVFSDRENSDIPSRSSLDQKTSDVVGEINYNFSEIGKIDYKFSLDHSMDDINYNNISTNLDFGKIQFNLDYLEQRNHIGKDHYASSGITLNFDEKSSLGFSTKRNFKTESTELYNLNYQYASDCLTAGILYRREFYDDVDDLKPKNSLMFTITFVPFSSVSSPSLK